MPPRSVIDTAEWEALRRRMQERRWLLAASVLVLLGMALLYADLARSLDAVQQQLKRGTVVNLSTVESSRALLPVFAGVYADSADRHVAAAHLYDVVVRAREASIWPWWTLRNVGMLNTRATAVPAHRAGAGGPVFRARLARAQSAAPGAEHYVPLLEGPAQLRAIKPGVVVRSPHVFRWTFWGLVAVFLAAFYGVHLFWHRRRFAGDAALLPVLHLLSGFGLWAMFSLQDPLRDTLQAQGFVEGVVAGCLLMALTSRLDFQHRFWRHRTFVWLLLAVAVGAVLFAAGTGPTGSDAKVNLALPGAGSVQPVELIKLLLVLFMAGYFARNWAFLRNLQQRDGLPGVLKRINLPRYRDLLPVAAGIGAALLTLYALRDMGPALVIGCTFLVLYGTARNRWLAVAGGFAVLVGGFWYAYRAEAVPVVASRIEMLLSPWENFVNGGEHLAHAYWALAAGGVTGQGLGAGSPSYIPAAHTDMVLAAIGEEAGLLGLFVVFALYAVLLHRAVYIALRANGVFSLFLGVGIALLSFFQILLIAGGAFGVLPLSGVVTPFLSYGKSSMVVNCILVGMLMSLSARPGTPAQTAVHDAHFRRPVTHVAGAAGILLVLLLAKAYYVQVVVARDWTIRPALVVRGSGQRAYTYNPRIHDARRQIPRGSIYDRNGIPLASSRWEELESFRAVYDTLGADLDGLDRTAARFYPFGALTFYLLGDIRTRVKWGADNSLYAEHAYLSHLRGYDNTPRAVEKKRTQRGAAEPIIRYNYAELLSLVRYGPESEGGRALLRRSRDVRLTVDVRLQQQVARILQERVPEGKTASVVVLDAASGDVLASVMHPLPQVAYDDPAAAHRNPDLFDRGYGAGAKPPGSTFKLVTAMAALNRDDAAAAWTYPVRASDRYARRGEPTGDVDLRRAITGSSNVYFAALAKEVVGVDSLLRMAEAFGFRLGAPGLGPRQKRALLAAPDNLRQVGFGQGPLVGSPLQVALVAATIAANGARPPVQWVRSPAPPRRAPEYVILPRHARLLAGHMRHAVTDRRGTARVLRDLAVPMAGKTGTAEERRTVRLGRRTEVRTVNHAWFTGFAPYREPGAAPAPRIAIAVLVEEGGHGGVVAAPIAGAVAEAAVALGLIPGD